MADIETTVPGVGTEPGTDDGADYIAAIEELKRNSVSREEYDKLAGEKKKLLDALVSGKTPEGLVPDAPKVSPDDLRKKLFGNGAGDLTNLDLVETTLALRDSLIGAGERDPSLPIGDKVQITSDTIDATERVATILRECVDFAQGDSGIFTAELQRRTKDTMIPRGRR